MKVGSDMLLRFSVANFLSIRDQVEFSMIATDSKQKPLNHVMRCGKYNVLKGSYLFGANASGKSTFIKSIDFFRTLILHGVQNVNLDKKYFRLDDSFANKPGVFQVDFWTNNHVYSYGFAISYKSSYILEEWLYEILDGQDRCIFYRGENEDGSMYCDTDLILANKDDNDAFEVYRKGIQNKNSRNIFFLRDLYNHIDADKAEYKPFVDTINWLRKIIIVFPNSSYARITSFLSNDENKELINLLQEFDTGVEDVQTIKKNIDTERNIPQGIITKIKHDFIDSEAIPGENSHKAFLKSPKDLLEIEINDGEIFTNKLGFNHGNDKDLFELKDESDGTRRLIHLLPLLREVKNGSVVFIDEIDRSLHTMATARFIEKIYDFTMDSYAQLITTTQDANLLDLKKIRQDEIWFIERNEKHGSELYPLSKYAVKYSDVKKDYLLGRYGGIPKFLERYLALEDDDEE